jgi:hypothetical protein
MAHGAEAAQSALYVRHVGLPFSYVWIFCNPRSLMEFIVPLAIGWWFLRRKPDQGQLQLAT